MMTRESEPGGEEPAAEASAAAWLEVGSYAEAHEPPDAMRLMASAWPGREEELVERLGVFIDYLLARNQRMNLTGDRTPELQWTTHVGDALPVAALIERALGGVPEGIRVLDAGSGGGIPGLVWAVLWPNAEVTLLEATGKKAQFLESAAELLNCGNVRVLNGRAEDLGRQTGQREKYDVVTARALAALQVLAEWTLPFLRVGGTLFAMKGPDPAPEIESARSAFRQLGAAEEPEIVPYTRGDGRECHLLIYRKIKPTSPGFPRKGGRFDDESRPECRR